MDKSVNKPVQTEENYRLTEENWATIDPMIGLSEDDIAAFFNNNSEKRLGVALNEPLFKSFHLLKY